MSDSEKIWTLRMTNNEAIEVLNNFDMQASAKADGAYQSTIGKMACDIAVAAIEKQIPKKPAQGEPYTWIDSVKVRGRYKEVKKTSYGHACPNCGNSVAKLRGEYCSDCGQRLDWSDT